MKKLLTITASAFLIISQIALANAQSTFTDLSSSDPSTEAIEYLFDTGTVEGYDDGTFRSINKINRAEFIKIAVESVTDNPIGENCFPDVNEEWFAKYVCYAKEKGYIAGYPDGEFKPSNNINFAEASKIIVNVFGIEPQNTSALDPWYRTFVEPLADKKAIPSSISDMDKFIARGEMSEVIWRVETENTDLDSLKYQELEGELALIESCTELKDLFLQPDDRYFVLEPVSSTDMGSGEGAVAESEASSLDFSETNLQVAGVDEADIVKTDGTYIYIIRDGVVSIVKADTLTETTVIEFDETLFYPTDLYVDGDRLVVLGTDRNYIIYDYGFEPFFPAFHDNRSSVYIYDITDQENPDLMRRLQFDGSLSTSRKVDDTLYLVLNKFDFYYYSYFDDPEEVEAEELLPRYFDSQTGKDEVLAGCTDIRYLPRERSLNYLITVAIDIDNDDGKIDSEVIVGSSENLYASRNNIYIASTNYDGNDYYYDYTNAKTLVHRFSLEPGKIQYEKTGKVPGTILNQFSMDEYEDHLRIATTKGHIWNTIIPSTNNLYILNQNLDIVGSVEDLAPGETIHSTRFLGARGYMVTFKKIDPLFVFDLADPNNPKVLGELKIPGYSDFLQPYDENHILGFGKDAQDPVEEESFNRDLDFAWYQGMKVSLFDVTDPSNPIQLFSVGIGDRGTNSEVLYNHKALLFDKDKELLAFPVSIAEVEDENASLNTFGETTFVGAQVYNLNLQDGFELLAEPTHMGDTSDYYWDWYDHSKVIKRILYIGNTLYTISTGEIRAFDLDTFEELDSLLLGT